MLLRLVFKLVSLRGPMQRDSVHAHLGPDGDRGKEEIQWAQKSHKKTRQLVAALATQSMGLLQNVLDWVEVFWVFLDATFSCKKEGTQQEQT